MEALCEAVGEKKLEYVKENGGGVVLQWGCEVRRWGG